MSRSGYTDDYDEFTELYRGAVRKAMKGKRGQAFFRDLRTALDVLPVKRLIYGTLRDAVTGEVCTLGAIGIMRNVKLPIVDSDDCGESSRLLGQLFNIAPSLAAEVQYMNDEASYTTETPEARYTRVSQWVDEQLATPPAGGENV